MKFRKCIIFLTVFLSVLVVGLYSGSIKFDPVSGTMIGIMKMSAIYDDSGRSASLTETINSIYNAFNFYTSASTGMVKVAPTAAGNISRLGISGQVYDGGALTTDIVPDSVDKRYCTDAQKVVIGNTSGANTGDETTATIKSKLQAASAANAGYLLDSDWSIFNAKISSTYLTSNYYSKDDCSGLYVPQTRKINGQALSGDVTITTSSTLATLTDANIASAEQGDLLYYAGDGKWGNIHHGTSGQYLKTLGNGANVQWDTPTAANTATTQITASGAMEAGKIYSNYLATASYTMTLPASAGLADGDWVGVVQETAGGNDSYVKLLMHMDGADEGTTFSDSSAAAHGNATVGGAANTETGSKKFGTAAYEGDGTTDYIKYADSADWDLGTVFTVEGWVNFKSTAGSAYFVCHGRGRINIDEPGWAISYASNTFRWNYRTAGGVSSNVEKTWTSPATGRWYHWAVVADESAMTLYIDGAKLAAGEAYTSNITDGDGEDLVIGASSADDSYAGSLNGYLDEVRITKGLARYTDNFTVKKSAFDVGGLTVDPDGTDAIIGLTDAAGDSVIPSNLGDTLFLRWNGRSWMVDRSYGTWTDNN